MLLSLPHTWVAVPFSRGPSANGPLPGRIRAHTIGRSACFPEAPEPYTNVGRFQNSTFTPKR